MLAPLLLFLFACAPPSGGWLLSLTDAEVLQNTDDCTENYLAAACGAPTAAPHADKSATALFGDDGVSDFVLLDGELLRREHSDGSWLYRSIDEVESQHVERSDDGYTLSAARRAGRSLELTLWDDGDGLEGVLVESTWETASWAESDLWYKGGDTAWGSAAALADLEGDWSNFVADIDCDSEPCRVNRHRDRAVVYEVHASR